jgi:hypothetical protein
MSWRETLIILAASVLMAAVATALIRFLMALGGI